MPRQSLVVPVLLAAFVAGVALPFAFDNEVRAEEKKSAPARKANFKREWCWAQDDIQRKQIQKLVGKAAPALAVGPWHNGTPPTLAELKGKIVLVDFWATWCGPCRAAVPKTNEIMQRYADKGVVVLGVCCTEERRGGRMTDVAAKTGMKYPTAQDIRNTTAAQWGVQWWPYYVIVDRHGVIRSAGLIPDKVDDALDEMLKEQPPE